MAALSLSCPPGIATAQGAAPGEGAQLMEHGGIAAVVARAAPSVVTITGENERWPRVPEMLDEWSMDDLMRRFMDRDFGPERPRPRMELTGRTHTGGFGVIVGADGLIATAISALPDSGDTVEVTLEAGSRHNAAIVGRDPTSGLALLRIDGAGTLPALEWSDADAPALGSEVLALGRSARFGATAWTGHVVAQDREHGVMVIDARIGASAEGAPLVGEDGRIAGIVGAGGIAGDAPGHVALAAHVARDVVQELSRSGSVARGYLGIRIQTVTTDLAPALGLQVASGALVTEIEPGAPAVRADLRAGDVITGIDGEAVTDADALSLAIMERRPGVDVTLEIWREGTVSTVEATLAAMPGTDGAVPITVDSAVAFPEIGLTLSDLTPEIRGDLGLPDDAAGVVVTATDASDAGSDIRVRDIIHAVQMQDVTSVEDVRATIETAQTDGRRRVLLLVERDGMRSFVSAPLRGAPG